MTDTTLQLTDIATIAPGFRLQWEKAQDCHVILYPEGMVKLSASAGAIMQELDGSRTVAEIIQRLSDQFNGADLGPDVINFLQTAFANGWLRHARDE